MKKKIDRNTLSIPQSTFVLYVLRNNAQRRQDKARTSFGPRFYFMPPAIAA